MLFFPTLVHGQLTVTIHISGAQLLSSYTDLDTKIIKLVKKPLKIQGNIIKIKLKLLIILEKNTKVSFYMFI